MAKKNPDVDRALVLVLGKVAAMPFGAEKKRMKQRLLFEALKAGPPADDDTSPAATRTTTTAEATMGGYCSSPSSVAAPSKWGDSRSSRHPLPSKSPRPPGAWKGAAWHRLQDATTLQGKADAAMVANLNRPIHDATAAATAKTTPTANKREPPPSLSPRPPGAWHGARHGNKNNDDPADGATPKDSAAAPPRGVVPHTTTRGAETSDINPTKTLQRRRGVGTPRGAAPPTTTPPTLRTPASLSPPFAPTPLEPNPSASATPGSGTTTTSPGSSSSSSTSIEGGMIEGLLESVVGQVLEDPAVRARWEAEAVRRGFLNASDIVKRERSSSSGFSDGVANQKASSPLPRPPPRLPSPPTPPPTAPPHPSFPHASSSTTTTTEARTAAAAAATAKTVSRRPPCPPALPVHPREQARAIERLLRLPEALLLAASTSAASATPTTSAAAAAADGGGGISCGTAASATIGSEPLDFRNRRYQMAFLETLQAMKRGRLVQVKGATHKLWLDANGKFLSWQQQHQQQRELPTQPVHKVPLEKPFLVVGELGSPLSTTSTTKGSLVKEGSWELKSDRVVGSLRIVAEEGEDDDYGTGDDGGGDYDSRSNSNSPVFSFVASSTPADVDDDDDDDDDARECLAWMSALASIRFANWWASADNDNSPQPSNEKKGFTPAASQPKSTRRFFHLWQASRVVLAELAGGAGSRIGGGGKEKLGSTALYLGEEASAGGSAAAKQRIAKPGVLGPRQAWRAVSACLAETQKGTATPWELPLDVAITTRG